MTHLKTILLLHILIASFCQFAFSYPDEDGLNDFYQRTRELHESIKEGEFSSETNKLALKLLVTAAKFKDNWNYANAIHYAHTLLGFMALKTQKITKAKKHLMLSAKHKGSPQLNTFGPTMRLANSLLEVNEKDIVIRYIKSTLIFWNSLKLTDDEPEYRRPEFKTKQWIADIQSGATPDFGSNLVN